MTTVCWFLSPFMTRSFGLENWLCLILPWDLSGIGMPKWTLKTKGQHENVLTNYWLHPVWETKWKFYVVSKRRIDESECLLPGFGQIWRFIFSLSKACCRGLIFSWQIKLALVRVFHSPWTWASDKQQLRRKTKLREIFKQWKLYIAWSIPYFLKYFWDETKKL